MLRELRKLVFGACCAAGALIGIWTSIWANLETEAHRDLGDQLVRMLKPTLAHFGVGLGIGVAVGLGICLTVLKPRSAEAADGPGSAL
jgi:ABC-type nitrate/sulfonate/bicarbonate transport system permease component